MASKARESVRLALVLAVAVAVVGQCSTAVGHEVPARAGVSGMDTASRLLIEEMTGASPTAQGLVRCLQSSDVLVLVRTTLLPAELAGDMRLLWSEDRLRVIEIRIQQLQGWSNRVLVLAHELQHAVEVGERPDIRSPRDLVRLIEAIGCIRTERERRVYETAAALQAAVRVGLEFGARRK